MQLTRGGEDVNSDEVAVSMVAMMILAGVGLMVAAMMNRRRFREMEHQERLAMIERGLLPSPESDPAGFDAGARFSAAGPDAGVRYRTAGILMIGFGLGLAVLLTFTAEAPGAGVGIGGGWAILGAASLLNYFLISKREPGRQPARRWTPGSTTLPREPPVNGSL
jgi:hypothetical protein